MRCLRLDGAAFADGAASVDITSDNQAVADEAYACSYPLCAGVTGADGAASVDITSDNDSVATVQVLLQ